MLHSTGIPRLPLTSCPSLPNTVRNHPSRHHPIPSLYTCLHNQHKSRGASQLIPTFSSSPSLPPLSQHLSLIIVRLSLATGGHHPLHRLSYLPQHLALHFLWLLENPESRARYVSQALTCGLKLRPHLATLPPTRNFLYPLPRTRHRQLKHYLSPRWLLPGKQRIQNTSRSYKVFHSFLLLVLLYTDLDFE